MINKIDPALDHLGNSQTIQITKEATVGDLLLGKCSKERPRMWLDGLMLELQRLGMWQMGSLCHLNKG